MKNERDIIAHLKDSVTGRYFLAGGNSKDKSRIEKSINRNRVKLMSEGKGRREARQKALDNIKK